MLTPDEERKIDKATFSATFALSNLPVDDPNSRILLEAHLWLATKLKEINNEASKYSEELYKANKELADVLERYEG